MRQLKKATIKVEWKELSEPLRFAESFVVSYLHISNDDSIIARYRGLWPAK